MEHSEQLDKLATALCKAQQEMGGAVKDSDNSFFKSKYADLTSVWKACKEALHNNGLSVIQSPVSIDGRIGVSTMLLHTSGQYVSDEYTLGVKKENDPQADGSSITYSRRYALAAFVGVCPVDDDAEAAMVRNDKPKPEPITPKDVAQEFRPKYCTKNQADDISLAGTKAGLTTPQVKDLVAWFREGDKLTSDEAVKLLANFPAVVANFCEIPGTA